MSLERIGANREVLRVTVALVVVIATCLLTSSSANATGEANTESCASFPSTELSPGFRSFMAECRAYEMITPPYVGGNQVHGVFEEPPSLSLDGEHLIVQAFAGFAGVENLEEDDLEFGAIYEFSRTTSGWRAEALEPPATEYPRSAFIAASASLTRSLWRVALPQGAGKEGTHLSHGDESSEMIVVREAAGDGRGTFTAIGPITAPGREKLSSPPSEDAIVVAESSDLADVLLQVDAIAKQTWPGDETDENAPSLYEYRAGGGSEPVLVGVSNVGALSGSPVNTEAHLISKCGTRLGSQSVATTYNAVSASGETVYFTALKCASGPPVNELYARVAGSKTVAISEPTSGDCPACDTSKPEEAGEGAVFEGASEDGSKVFFASTQELLPGAVGESLYEYSFEPGRTGRRLALVAPNVAGVARISEDGSRVYFESTSVSAPGGEQEGYNLYVYDTQTGQTGFVATLMTGAEAAGHTTSQIETVTHVKREDQRRPFATTRDGDFLVFPSSRERLTVDDNSSVQQLYEYDAATGSLARVSVGSSGGYLCRETGTIQEGYNCDGNTRDPTNASHMVEAPSYISETKPTSAASDLSVAENGTVTFASALALTPQAVPGRVTATANGAVQGETENVYEYRDGRVYLISPADESAPLIEQAAANQGPLLGMDTTGQDVFFQSSDALVPQASDTQSNLYDARVGGGFPGVAAAAECAGDPCQGALAAAVAAPPPVTMTATGGQNLELQVVPNSVLLAPRRQSLLAHALRACRRERRHKRLACEARARKRYGINGKSSRRGS